MSDLKTYLEAQHGAYWSEHNTAHVLALVAVEVRKRQFWRGQSIEDVAAAQCVRPFSMENDGSIFASDQEAEEFLESIGRRNSKPIDSIGIPGDGKGKVTT